MIIGVLSLKGGVGKTTTALHLAACALEDGLEPAIIDADEEGSALSWAARAEARGAPLPFPVVGGERNSLARQAKNLEAKSGTVFIDTPPNNREALTMAGMVSNLIVVPVVPSGVDVDRLANTLAVLGNIEAARGSMALGILLTRYRAGEVLARQASEALADHSVFDTRIRDLARYRQSFGAPPSYLFEYRSAWEEIKEVL